MNAFFMGSKQISLVFLLFKTQKELDGYTSCFRQCSIKSYRRFKQNTRLCNGFLIYWFKSYDIPVSPESSLAAEQRSSSELINSKA